MSFNFKVVVEDYCGTGKLSYAEVDYLKSAYIKTMSNIFETLSPANAYGNNFKACKLQQGSSIKIKRNAMA